jgi:hypothetical protein
MIDQALGESSHIRYHSRTLHTAIHGLFRALDGWRRVATHLGRLPERLGQQQANTILRSLPSELRSARDQDLPTRWMEHPLAMRRNYEKGVQTLMALPADTPSLRLLADETARALAGMVHVLDVDTISLVDANSYWVDGYFEETTVAPIHVGDRAQIKLMGYSQIIRGHVDSIARAINVSNAQPNNQGVATVMPGSTVGVNPVLHPGWFGKGRNAGDAFGYAPISSHKHKAR